MNLNSGDTAWLLISTALVIMMTAPGLALFYGGLVARKSVLSTLMHSFFMLGLIGIQWVLFGYTLAFGPDAASLIGRLNFLGLSNVGVSALAGTHIPHILFAMYQGAFAIITVALISGAFAERKSFKAFVLFSLLWATLIYDPVAHWVWGGGWLQKLGVMDFAGGLVVHVSSGVSALIAALVIGRRTGYPTRVSHPHNIPLVVTGAGLLWFGWFGFNGGSALAANGVAAMAVATTMTSGAAGALVWSCVEWFHKEKPSVIGTVSGAVAGLAGVTNAAGFVTVPAALFIGTTTALLCYCAVTFLKSRLGYDDTLDVFGVHGLGGIWGAIATGLFATTSVNPAGANGLFYGNPHQMLVQVIGVGAIAAVAAVGSFVILRLVALITPLRVTAADEQSGLDRALHGEVAYSTGRSEEVLAD